MRSVPGKTIEAGLVLMELARRGRAGRVLIACPAGLQDQWVDEMRFRAFAGEGRSSGTGRSRLARTLADHSRELLLLSATPHNGYQESFASLLQLLSPHLAADDGRLDPELVRPYLVRRLKDDVAKGDLPQPISRRNPPRPIKASRCTCPMRTYARSGAWSAC
jgi:SNF2 family DNA or RNA helicase